MRYMLHDRKSKRRTAEAKGEASQGRYDADQTRTEGAATLRAEAEAIRIKVRWRGKRVGGRGANSAIIHEVRPECESRRTGGEGAGRGGGGRRKYGIKAGQSRQGKRRS